MKLYCKDGITVQVHTVVEEARIRKLGYKEVVQPPVPTPKPVAPQPPAQKAGE